MIMNIAIDGSLETVPLESNPSLGELFAQLRGWCGARKRVLVSVKVDGRALELRSETAAEKVPPGTLAVSTSASSTFALKMIGDLRTHLGALAGHHDEAAQLTVAAKYEGAMKAFEGCFKGWALLTGAMQELGRLLQADFKALDCGGGSAESLILKVVDSLTRFKEGFRKSDAVLLGDIAQYELKPQLEEWGRIVDALARLAESRA
jgi:hypothetical protein